MIRILLTTYNIDSRADIYERCVEWWCRNTDFPIYVVDSANKGFDDLEKKYDKLRVHKHVNRPGDLDPTVRYGPSQFELYSLHEACLAFPELVNGDTESGRPCGYTFKITGKYILPTFAEEIKKLLALEQRDVICQFVHEPNWQNSECFGCRPALLQKFVKHAWGIVYRNCPGRGYIYCMETALYMFVQHKLMYRLSKMPIPIEYRVERNDHRKLEYL